MMHVKSTQNARKCNPHAPECPLQMQKIASNVALTDPHIKHLHTRQLNDSSLLVERIPGMMYAALKVQTAGAQA